LSTIGNSRVILVTGGIGTGKTTSLLAVRRWANNQSIGIAGIISPRIFEGEILVGYDALDCATGECFPLARKSGTADEDWIAYPGLGYLFSTEGLSRANRLLIDVADDKESVITILDEVGKLELGGCGLKPGLDAVLSSAVDRHGILLLSCRLQALDMVGNIAKELDLEAAVWSSEDGIDLISYLQ
jgi:nucleoside-triphosphatase THEP1